MNPSQNINEPSDRSLPWAYTPCIETYNRKETDGLGHVSTVKEIKNR